MIKSSLTVTCERRDGGMVPETTFFGSLKVVKTDGKVVGSEPPMLQLDKDISERESWLENIEDQEGTKVARVCWLKGSKTESRSHKSSKAEFKRAKGSFVEEEP